MRFLNYSNLIDPLLKGLRSFTVKSAEIKKGDRILDVACGTGDQVFHYVKAGAFASGIDLNAGMIEIAEKRKRRERVNGADFQVASASDLPFEDSVFDKASISLALHEIDSGKRSEVISEMKRVVRKGGYLLFIDFSVPLPPNPFSYMVKTVECLAGKTNHENFKSYLAKGGLPVLLRENGLEGQEVSHFNDGLLMMIKVKK